MKTTYEIQEEFANDLKSLFMNFQSEYQHASMAERIKRGLEARKRKAKRKGK